MLDEQKWIGAQAIVKSLLENVPYEKWGMLDKHFGECIRIMEKYSMLDPEEELLNTGIRIPKAYWDAQTPESKEQIIGKGNVPRKVLDKEGKSLGWFIHCKKKDVDEFKKMMDDRETYVAP
jgi:hypothetical protein